MEDIFIKGKQLCSISSSLNIAQYFVLGSLSNMGMIPFSGMAFFVSVLERLHFWGLYLNEDEFWWDLEEYGEKGRIFRHDFDFMKGEDRYRVEHEFWWNHGYLGGGKGRAHFLISGLGVHDGIFLFMSFPFEFLWSFDGLLVKMNDRLLWILDKVNFQFTWRITSKTCILALKNIKGTNLHHGYWFDVGVYV